MKMRTNLLRKPLLFIAVFVVALVVLMPPSAVIYFLNPAMQQRILSSNGFVWYGSAQLAVQVKNELVYAQVSWRVCPRIDMPLLVCLTATHKDITISTHATYAEQQVQLYDTEINANMTTLAPMVSPAFAGSIANGQMHLHFTDMVFAFQERTLWPLVWNGTGTLSDLQIRTLPGETIQAELLFDNQDGNKEASDKLQPAIVHVRSDVMQTSMNAQAKLISPAAIELFTKVRVAPNAQNSFISLMRFIGDSKKDGTLEWQQTVSL